MPDNDKAPDAAAGARRRGEVEPRPHADTSAEVQAGRKTATSTGIARAADFAEKSGVGPAAPARQARAVGRAGTGGTARARHAADGAAPRQAAPLSTPSSEPPAPEAAAPEAPAHAPLRGGVRLRDAAAESGVAEGGAVPSVTAQSAGRLSGGVRVADPAALSGGVRTASSSGAIGERTAPDGAAAGQAPLSGMPRRMRGAASAGTDAEPPDGAPTPAGAPSARPAGMAAAVRRRRARQQQATPEADAPAPVATGEPPAPGRAHGRHRLRRGAAAAAAAATAASRFGGGGDAGDDTASGLSGNAESAALRAGRAAARSASRPRAARRTGPVEAAPAGAGAARGSVSAAAPAGGKAEKHAASAAAGLKRKAESRMYERREARAATFRRRLADARRRAAEGAGRTVRNPALWALLAVLLVFSILSLTTCSGGGNLQQEDADIDAGSLNANMSEFVDIIKGIKVDGEKYDAKSIAAMLGNIGQETAGTCDPTIVEGGGHSKTLDGVPASSGYGIFQFTSAENKDALRRTAKRLNVSTGSMKAQVYAFVAIVGKSSPLAPKHLNAMNRYTNNWNSVLGSYGHTYSGAIPARTVAFHDHYERSADTYAGLQKRISNAYRYYSMMTSGTVSLKDVRGARRKVIAAAESKKGCDYVLGAPRAGQTASSQSMFDCSGLVYWSYNRAGVHIPRLTAQGYYGTFKRIKKSEAKPGDVVFFHYGTSGDFIGHIGIYLGGGRMIHTGNNTSKVHEASVSEWGAPYAYGTLIKDDGGGKKKDKK